MAVTLTGAQIAGVLSNTQAGTRTLSIPISVLTPVDSASSIAITTGNNTINVPTGATMAILIPPASAASWILKGIAGDTGIQLNTVNPTMVGLSGVSSFVITAGGNMVIEVIFL